MIFIKDFHPIPDVQKRIDQESDPLLQVPLSLPSGIDGREQMIMKEGILAYNRVNDRYGLLSSDLWVHTGFHCGKRMEVFMDGKWILSRMEMNPKREWYLVETPYSGNLEYIRVRIEE